MKYDSLDRVGDEGGDGLELAGRRVLLVGPYPPPYGGPGVHMQLLRGQLEKHGADCRILNIGPLRRESIEDVLPVSSALDFVVEISRWSRRGYHVHHFFNAESWKAIALAAGASRLARWLGGGYSVAFIGGPIQRHLGKTSMASRLLEGVLSRAEFVVCNNESVKRALTRFCAEPGRIHPIQSFHIEQVREVGVIDEATRAFAAGHNPLLSAIVHPRFETENPHHEIELLLGAVERLSQVERRIGCVVVGGADALDHYRGLVKSAGFEERFHFAGELSHADCLAVMRLSDVFVRAYNRDGSSSSVREALALHVPTVASDNPQHPPEVVPFEPDDAGSLCAALRRVIDRLQEKKGMLAVSDVSGISSMRKELELFAFATSDLSAEANTDSARVPAEGRRRAASGNVVQPPSD